MKALKGDLFDQKDGVLAIATNGYVTLSGKAVMGKGVARVAKKKFNGIDTVFGKVLLSQGRRSGNAGKNLALGNHVALIWNHPKIVSFPTKWNWWEKADLGLIERSALELVALADYYHWPRIYLPRVGCGNGGLSWDSDVYPVLQNYLDDRFTVVIP